MSQTAAGTTAWKRLSAEVAVRTSAPRSAGRTTTDAAGMTAPLESRTTPVNVIMRGAAV